VAGRCNNEGRAAGVRSQRQTVLTEALQGTRSAVAQQAAERTAVSAAGATGKATLLEFQQLEGRRYFDTACRVALAAAPRPLRCE